MADNRKDAKSINVEQVVNYLNHTFAETAFEVFKTKTKAFRTSSLGKPIAGTPLYYAQVEFCYLIDEIQRGPTYMLPKAISAANDFISSLKESAKQEESA